MVLVVVVGDAFVVCMFIFLVVIRALVVVIAFGIVGVLVTRIVIGAVLVMCFCHCHCYSHCC